VIIRPIAADGALAQWLQVSGRSSGRGLADQKVVERRRPTGAARRAGRRGRAAGGGKLIGILVIGEKLSGEIFSRGELDLLGVVTGQAATALENARLYEAVRQAYEELSHTQAQNARLEAAVAARARDLAEAHERLTILDRSKDEFLNLISHELRTPLNGLLGVGELIWEKSLQEEQRAPGVRPISPTTSLVLDDALLLTQIDVSGSSSDLRFPCMRR
jgi:signal transduction histidine kinase